MCDVSSQNGITKHLAIRWVVYYLFFSHSHPSRRAQAASKRNRSISQNQTLVVPQSVRAVTTETIVQPPNSHQTPDSHHRQNGLIGSTSNGSINSPSKSPPFSPLIVNDDDEAVLIQAPVNHSLVTPFWYDVQKSYAFGFSRFELLSSGYGLFITEKVWTCWQFYVDITKIVNRTQSRRWLVGMEWLSPVGCLPHNYIAYRYRYLLYEIRFHRILAIVNIICYMKYVFIDYWQS